MTLEERREFVPYQVALKLFLRKEGQFLMLKHATLKKLDLPGGREDFYGDEEFEAYRKYLASIVA